MLKISHSGLQMLEKIVRSCAPTPTNGGMPGKEYLLSLSRQGNDVSFENFKKDFPKINCAECLYNVYDHLALVANEKGRGIIDKDFVINFFAGSKHIERAKVDIKNERISKIIGELYAKKAFVSHVLLPIEITDGENNHYSGVYRNSEGKIFFKISNLVPFPEEAERIKKGMYVFTHYASIVSSEIEASLVKNILQKQAQNKEFISACKRLEKIGGLDHKKMLHYPWAEKVVSVCRL